MNLTFKTFREHPFPGNVLLRVTRLLDDYALDEVEKREPVTDPDDANVVSSHFVSAGKGFRHRPVLDIDFPCAVVPSSTPGHFHLYLDKALTWHQYEKLLVVMAEVGILEQGYVDASIERGHTAVRVPWIRKGQDLLGTYSDKLRDSFVKLALAALKRGTPSLAGHGRPAR